jgi:hypothetical protein
MNTTSNTEPTDDQVDAAILAALTEGGGGDDLHSWAEIRRRVPGSLDHRNERLIALWFAGRVYTIKIAGRNYVSLDDGHPRSCSPLVL